MRITIALPKVVVCVLAFAPFAAAQAPQPQYGESIEVRLHNLDAVVTDKDGKPVTGLTKEDFVLLENGVVQEITNFSAYAEQPAPAAPSLGIVRDAAPTEIVTAAATPPPPRRFVFFIDEMSIQAAARNKLKKNAAELIRAMRPGDVATVVRPTGTTKIVQDYTGDVADVERALNKAIDSCKINLRTPAFRELENLRRALKSAERPDEVSAAKREYVNAATDRVEQRLGQLRALVTSMSASEGKKVLVVVTSGLSAKPGQDAYTLDEQIGLFERRKRTVKDDEAMEASLDENGLLHEGTAGRLSAIAADVQKWGPQPTWKGMDRAEGGDFKSMIDTLARTAAADGVTIYALEPEVPMMLDITRGAESSTVGTTIGGGDVSAKYTIPSEMIGQLLHHEGETLTSMADKTGGRWFRGIGSIDETFRQMNNDLSVYYSLAYRARGDAKIRTLKLTVKNRPELQVRTRSEVIDRDKARGMADRVVAELVYPGQTNDLQMTVTADDPQRDGKMFIVPVQVVIPIDKITFVRSQSGTYKARVSLHYATAVNQKDFVSYGRQEQIIELSDKQYAEQKKIRYRYTSSITVPKGNVRIALGVTDAISSVSSLQTVAVKTQ